MDLSSAMSGIGSSFAGAIPSLLFWTKWVIIIGIIGLCLFALYFLVQYKYKVIVFERGGSGNLDTAKSHFIRKVKLMERAREIRDSTGVSHWKLLFARKKIEPVDMQHVYPGNIAFLYKVSPDTYVPVDFTCGNPESHFNPIPQAIRRWMALEIQQSTQDYQHKTNWDMYAPMAIMGGTVLFCCILTGVVIYLAFSNVHQLIPSLEMVGERLGDINVIPGVPPQ